MWIVASGTAFMASVVLHAFAVRVFRGANSVVSFFGVGVVVGCTMLAVVGTQTGFGSPQFMAAAATYAFACELYVFLFTLALSSISANLLAKLHAESMTTAEVETLYDSRLMVSNRVERLIKSGFMDRSPSGVVISVRGKRLLRTLNRLRSFFGHDVLC